MNRNTIIILATIAAGLGCLFCGAQPKIWQQPQTVAVNRELPRSLTLPFDTKESALSQTAESKYIQTLDGKWERSQSGDAVTYSIRYKRPFSWIDRLLFVYIEGATSAYEVRVNGKDVGYNQSSSTPAEFDITKESVEGNNTLEITIHTSAASTALSNANVGATLARLTGKVYIISPPKVRIRDWDISSKISGQTGRMELGVALKSHLLNARGVRLYYELYSPDGKLITEGHRDAKLDMKREDTIRFFVEIPNVKSWSHETPNLYTMLLKTQHEGRFTEYVRVKTGVRDIEIKDGNLVINGYPLQLAVKELDAISDNAEQLRDQLVEIKSEGYNAIRIKNGPQRQLLYNLCDQLGLYVCDQADINTSAKGESLRVGGNPSNDPMWEQSYIDRAKTMYYASQNHPSVIMFALGENSANGYNLYESYLAMKEIEKTRPIVYLGAKGEWNSDAVAQNNSGADRHARVVMYNEPIVKATSQISTISQVNATEGRYSITNHYKYTPLALQLHCVTKKGRKVVSEGTIDLFVAPNSTSEFVVPLGEVPSGTKLSVTINAQRPKQITTDYYWSPPSAEQSKTYNPIKLLRQADKEVETLEIIETKTFNITTR